MNDCDDNIGLAFEKTFLSLGESVKSALENERSATDSQIKSLNDKFDTILSGDTNLSEKVSRVNELLDSLDLNKNGKVVDELIALKKISEKAKALSLKALKKANEALDGNRKLNEKLNKLKVDFDVDKLICDYNDEIMVGLQKALDSFHLALHPDEVNITATD